MGSENSLSFRPPDSSVENVTSQEESRHDADNPGNDSETNTATVVVFGIPQTELVGRTDKSPDAIDKDRQEHWNKYFNLEKPGSPFVTTPGAGGDDDDDDVDKNDDKGGFSFNPGNFGNGSGDDIEPDEVADTFKLSRIGGLTEQKEYLQRSIILPLVRPNVLKEWGVCPPKGILLHGPPGTGKTFMAKALVNELKSQLGTKVNFFYRKGGDVFSMWFGESQRKLRQVFDTAKAMSPSVIFFDEIDGLCPSRAGSHNHGTEAYSSVVTCFLGQMDGLENGKVFVIAATNRLDAVDPAVRRPGRFDKHLAFGFPDETARRTIIRIHTGQWSQPDRPQQDLIIRLAQKTMGFSGADLEKLCKDVVYTAIEANDGIIDDNMKVTENHWNQAMSSMQRTAVNNFGSYLYIPTKRNQIISKLIEPLVTQVMQKVTPMLTTNSLNSDSTTFPWIHKSFLLYIRPGQSPSFLNNQILQGLLSSPLFNKMSLFELNTATVTNKVLSGSKPTIMAVVQDIVNQAQDAQQTENCVVVIIPNINELLQLAHANHISPKLVLKALSKVQGPRMFLLATSSVPVEDISEEELITELFFNRYMAAANPIEENLKHFFQFVLVLKRISNPDKAELIDEIVLQAAKHADKHNYERILSLASALAEVNVEQDQTDGRLKEEFKNIFDKYQTSPL